MPSYGGDSVRQKFTGYERDNEIGLDYAQARYYAGHYGRFSSPDEPFVDQFEDEPQSWNLYVYVRNNPLVFIDPTGMAAEGTKKSGDCPEGRTCYKDEGGNLVYKDENGEEIHVGPTTAVPRHEIDQTLLLMHRSPRRWNQFDRAMRNLGSWLRSWIRPAGPPVQARPAQPGVGPPSPQQTNPRANLPGAAQRLPSMGSLSSATAATMLQSAGFSHRSTTSGGNQQWRHPDGSTVWLMNEGRVVRVPGSNALQQSGLNGRGWRVDPATGNITRPHQNVSSEIVF